MVLQKFYLPTFYNYEVDEILTHTIDYPIRAIVLPQDNNIKQSILIEQHISPIEYFGRTVASFRFYVGSKVLFCGDNITIENSFVKITFKMIHNENY